MRRLLYASAFAALPLLAFGPTAAVAASPSQEQCEAQGGTFSKEQGAVQCVTTV